MAMVLGGFVDSLVQSFENCRSGLTDEQLKGGEEAVGRFFLERYEHELPRLREAVKLQEPVLTGEQAQRLYDELDGLVRKVLVPAYARLALRFSPRERNDFYLVKKESLRAAERIGFGAAGIAVGAFVIWAPWIPLWSKEWVLPFMVGGLLFPNLRRYFGLKRYERQLNELVARTDREIERINNAYLMAPDAAGVLEAPRQAALPEGTREADPAEQVRRAAAARTKETN